MKLFFAVAICLFGSSSACAITIDTVPIGNPGNAPDTRYDANGFGAVGVTFRIATTEVTNSQYVAFLNGVDPTGTNLLALYNSGMSDGTLGGINFSGGAANGSKYSIKSGRDNNPVVYVSWLDAIRFTNWMHNGQGAGSTENGAYTLPSATPTRNPGALWWLPSENEWYKAAYHKNDGITGNYWDYPTSTSAVPYSDQPPGNGAPDPSNTANFSLNDGSSNGYNDGFAVTGSPSMDFLQNYLTNGSAYTSSDSPYGTFDQGGNVREWNEALISGSFRGARGGSWSNYFNSDTKLHASNRDLESQSFEGSDVGFRVASIAAPSVLGDYNNNGKVDAGDYVLWRKGGPLLNQVDDPNTVNGADYTAWRQRFGNPNPGSGSSLGGADAPEPSAILLSVAAIAASLTHRRKSAVRNRV